MENQPKISTVEAFLLIVVAIIADVLSVAPVLNWIAWLGMSGVIIFLKYGKEIMPMGNLVAFIAEFIPFISILPLYTAGIALTIWIDRHPTGVIAQTAQKAQDAVKRQRGGAVPKTAVPGVKSPVGSIPAPSAPQVALAKAPTAGFAKIQP